MIHLLLFILGCCTGSFVNVVFSRKDWYKGRSRCDMCGYTLRWYDLVPVISYLILGGKCRKCKTKIDASHLISELMMGAAFLVSSFCFEQYGVRYGFVAFMVLLIIAIAAIEDYKEQMVYSFVLNGGIIVAVLVKCGYCLSFGKYIAALDIMGSVFILKILMMLVAIIFKDKIGSGDFDILVIIFVLGGISGLILSVTFASLLGCIIYLPQIILKKRDRKDPFPFIPLLLMGTMGYLLV